MIIKSKQSDQAVRFVKLDAAGKSLRGTAADWVAVLDHTTKLIWTRDDLPGGSMNWAAAKKAPSALRLCKFKDWRLPTRVELLTLVDDTRYNPAINTDFFKCQSNWYWTSTPYKLSPAGCAWFVGFSYGNSNCYYQSFGCFVRAVRSSTASSGSEHHHDD